MNKLTILSIALVSLMTVTIIGLPIEEQAKAESFIGNFGDGYDEGKENGADDWDSGYEHNSQCPPNDSLTWCAGYKSGYEVGWVERVH